MCTRPQSKSEPLAGENLSAGIGGFYAGIDAIRKAYHRDKLLEKMNFLDPRNLDQTSSFIR